MDQRGSGEELRTILEFLQEDFPGYVLRERLDSALGMDAAVFVRSIAYSIDKGWVVIREKGNRSEGPYKLTAEGIDKLNSWTGDDDVLEI